MARELDFGGWLGNWDFGEWLGSNRTLGDG